MVKYFFVIVVLLVSCSQNTNKEPGNDSSDTPLVINNHMQPDNMRIGKIDTSFLQFWEQFKLIAKTRDIVSFREVSLDTLEPNGLLIDKREFQKKDLSDIFNVKLMENWEGDEYVSIFYGDQDLSLARHIIQKNADSVSNPFIDVAILGPYSNGYKFRVSLNFLKTKKGYKLIGYIVSPISFRPG